MGIIIDLLLAAVVIVSVWSGVKRGFVRSVMNLITFAAAFFCSWFFTPSLAAVFNERFLLDKITAGVSSSINPLISSGVESLSLSNLFAEKPEAFVGIINRYGADIGALQAYFNSLTGGADEVADKISARIAEPVSFGLSEVLAFVAIFFGVAIILKIAALILDAVFSLPVLNAFNRVAGFILGAVCGLAYVWVMGVALIAALPFLAMLFPEIFGRVAQEGSYLLNFIKNLNISDLIKTA